MIFDSGRIVEMGRPKELLGRKDSKFARLAWDVRLKYDSDASLPPRGYDATVTADSLPSVGE